MSGLPTTAGIQSETAIKMFEAISGELEIRLFKDIVLEQFKEYLNNISIIDLLQKWKLGEETHEPMTPQRLANIDWGECAKEEVIDFCNYILCRLTKPQNAI